MTASSLANGKYAMVTDGGADNGLYVKTAGSWVKSDYDPTAQSKDYVDSTLAQLNKISINSGKNYPLKSLPRNNITSAPRTEINNALLDVKVYGALPNHYYRIAYLKNGLTSLGDYPYGVQIDEMPIEGYENSNVASTTIINYRDPAPDLPRGGIHTQVIKSPKHPDFEVHLTFDTDKLPPVGGFINLKDEGNAAWSWVIDPSCYNYERSKEYTDTAFLEVEGIVNNLGDTLVNANSLTINSGKNYPFKAITRGGILSEPNIQLNDALLDVSIIGARPDKIYRIGYLKNGYDGLGDYAYGIAVYEYDKDYTNELRIIDYRDPAPDLVRGGIQSQTVNSVVYTDFSIELTFDTDKLPPAGTNINLMRDIDKGYSWIIDPSTYQLKLPKNGVYYSINSTDDISFTYQSGVYLYRVTFGKNGFNNLPNIKKIERTVITRPHVWSVISETDTDYLPPMVVRAVNDGDDVTSLYYTGGNHGSSGSSSGSQTARNMLYKIKIDGQDAAYQKSGYTTNITLHIVNELMAYNTITLNRYVIRQCFNVTLKAGQIIVNSDVKALEPVEITTENGLQLYAGGYQGTMLMLGGQTVNRVKFSSGVSSGKKHLQPDAFATVLINSFDQMAMWMDRAYGAGDGRYVSDQAALIRSGSRTNTKFYNAIVANSPTTLEKGEGYKWRGGYAIERKEAPTGYDNVFSRDDGFVVAVDASNYTIID